MVREWWVGGVALGFFFPNPWGWDGHSSLTCGSAFLGRGYQPTDPGCPVRRSLSGGLAVVLVVGGGVLAWTNVLARWRAVRYGR